MLVSMIVAMDEGRCIGRDGELPWHLRADLRRYKALTMGHHILMGRLTYESIGRALPGRQSIVITRQPGYQAPGCQVAHSLDSALDLARAAGEEEAFVIGGAQIYALALPLADRFYLTRVHARLECDTYFPPFDLQDWRELERSFYPADEHNQYASTYSLLARDGDLPLDKSI